MPFDNCSQQIELGQQQRKVGKHKKSNNNQKMFMTKVKIGKEDEENLIKSLKSN